MELLPIVEAVETGRARPTPLASRHGAVLAALSAASVIVTSTAGRLITAAPVKGWYKTLAKPWFNPPNWAFPVAWTLLFALMAIAFWRVLRAPPGAPGRKRAIALFLAQLVVNVGWSAAFFGANSPLAGLIVIVPFLAMIVATGRAFHAIDSTAGWLLAPYVAWVSFATLLNEEILRLN
jgi:benzodiazapine receptor